MRNLILLITLFLISQGVTFSQRRLKIKVIIDDSTQFLKLKIHSKKGDIFDFSENFIWADYSFDTTNIERIALQQISLPEYESSSLFILNDSIAYHYEYDEKSGGLDSTKYKYLEDITRNYHYYYFMAGNDKRNYRYKIPIWINPNILITKPSKAAFYLIIKFDQMEVIKEILLYDDCKITYRNK